MEKDNNIMESAKKSSFLEKVLFSVYEYHYPPIFLIQSMGGIDDE